MNNNNTYYRTGAEDLLDDVKELWEELNKHHKEKSEHFKEYYENYDFQARKEKILKKAKTGNLKIDIAIDGSSMKKVGYCISSMDNEKKGEVDSIYITDEYRNNGIGVELMERGLRWMEDKGAVKKMISVVDGNEDVLSFYKKFGFYSRMMLLEQK